MIKVNYNFKALSPIHTGSDSNTGTLKEFRKHKVPVNQEVKFKSNFSSESERILTLVEILYSVWKSIDISSISSHRLMRI